MTREEFETMMETMKSGVSSVYEELAEFMELNSRLTSDNARLLQELESMRSNQNTQQETVEEEQTMPIPQLPENPPRVRFLSRTSSMGGLANIRAYMQDNDINVKRLKLEGSTYTPPEDTLIINWGGGFDIPQNLEGFTGRWLNKLYAVKIAASKTKTFNALAADEELRRHIPEFTVSRDEAANKDWERVYCRETVYGHSGDGITVINRGDELPRCPLYVEGLNIRHEYRVHVVNGYIKIQKKARLDAESPNMDVRNLEGGWTYINEFTLGSSGRQTLTHLGSKTLDVIGLDFGAVDIVKTEDGEWIILEVNTAPGVTSPSNIEFYAKALIGG